MTSLLPVSAHSGGSVITHTITALAANSTPAVWLCTDNGKLAVLSYLFDTFQNSAAKCHTKLTIYECKCWLSSPPIQIGRYIARFNALGGIILSVLIWAMWGKFSVMILGTWGDCNTFRRRGLRDVYKNGGANESGLGTRLGFRWIGACGCQTDQ